MVQDLIEAGHRLADIAEYTLQQVLILRNAARRKEAARRRLAITDMGLTIGSILGGSESLEVHLNLLGKIAEGDRGNDR